MDVDQLADLLRLLTRSPTRRAALRALAASICGGALLSLLGGDSDETAAKQRKRHRAHKQQRRRNQARAEKADPNCRKAGQTAKEDKDKPCCRDLVEDATGQCASCDVCASGCPFNSVQDAIDNTLDSNITICAGTYVETITINRDLTLSGAGDGADAASNTILDGDGAGSVVSITAGVTVGLQNLRLTGGNATSGGGIQNLGNLTLSGCTVSRNTAAFGGGIDSEGSGATHATLALIDSSVSENTADQLGGGIFADGHSTVTLTRGAVTSNTATQEGGGIATDDTVVTVTLTDSDVSGNTGLNGGGIFNVGALALTDSTVSRNTALDPGPGTLHGDGGGIFNTASGTVTLTASTVTGNDATHEGGGVANHGVVSCGDPGAVNGNTAGTAGTDNCFDDGGSGCGGCNP